MWIERQSGISVATSVLAFVYKDKKINIPDTPVLIFITELNEKNGNLSVFFTSDCNANK